MNARTERDVSGLSQRDLWGEPMSADLDLTVTCDFDAKPHRVDKDDRPCRNPRPVGGLRELFAEVERVRAERDALAVENKALEQLAAEHLTRAMDRKRERDALRVALTEARKEIDRWGHGDMHYGPMPRDHGVVNALAAIDELLAAVGEGETP